MNKSNKLLIISIAIVFMLILILILALLLYSVNKDVNNENINQNISNIISNNVDNKENQNILNEEENIQNVLDKYNSYQDTIEEEKNVLKNVKDKTQYFTVKALYSNYISQIKYGNKESLLDIVSEKYMANQNITEKNIIDQLKLAKKEDDQDYTPIITEMLAGQLNDTQKIFIVKGYYRVTESNKIFEDNIIIKWDTSNKTYEIYPNQFVIDNGYNKLKHGDNVTFEVDEIVQKNNNRFEYLLQEEMYVAREYFNHYKELINYYPDIAYSKLDSRYVSRFEDLELYNPLMDFDENITIEEVNQMIEDIEEKQVVARRKNYDKYLKENKKRLSLMRVIQKFKINKNFENLEYQVEDNYGNTMIFKNTGEFLNYTVELDNYNSTRYNKFNSKQSVEEKILIIQNMINTKDYIALYDVLDETFKKDNFATINDFEKYIKKNFYEINKIDIIKTTKDKYYICECRITDNLTKTKIKRMTIILDDTSISFKK